MYHFFTFYSLWGFLNTYTSVFLFYHSCFVASYMLQSNQGQAYADIQEATNSHDYTRAGTGNYEVWTELLANRDWAALEEIWSQANDAPGGEVADGLTPNGN